MPSLTASSACSLECQFAVSAGSKSFNRKCFPLSTRNALASFPTFIFAGFLSDLCNSDVELLPSEVYTATMAGCAALTPSHLRTDREACLFKSDAVDSDSFECDFLTDKQQSKQSYQRSISSVAALLASALPEQAYTGKSAAALAALLDFDPLPRFPRKFELLLDKLKLIIANSVVVRHPHTIAHLHCPPLVSALAAEVVISGLNQSMDSFDQAPIATVLEQHVTRWLCAEAGLPETADGTFTTGGTQSNYLGLLLARDAFLKSMWNWSAQKSGLHPEARRLRILCSEAAHFTVEKSASQLGLGTDAVIRVEADDQFRMKPDALRKSLEKLHTQELLPFAVVATAGTTDFGSVDPLPDIANLARSAGAWFHVDAAYGGALLFSKIHASQLAGI